MSDFEFPIPTLPPFATVQDVRDYCEYHVQQGRGKYVVKGRMMSMVIPPIGHDSHDDPHNEVYLNLIPE